MSDHTIVNGDETLLKHDSHYFEHDHTGTVSAHATGPGRIVTGSERIIEVPPGESVILHFVKPYAAPDDVLRHEASDNS